jgi:hypothetical protein
MFELHPLRATSTMCRGPVSPSGGRDRLRSPPRSGTLRLVDSRTNGLGHPVAVGGNGVLGGPTDPTVTVTFSVRLKQKAAGRTFLVEVLATDDVGRRQGFDLAGRLTVSR